LFSSSFVNAGSKKNQRAALYIEFVEMTDDDRSVLKCTVTGDESWCFMYDPETKRHSVTWLSPKEPKAQKVIMQKSRVKTMLTAFFYDKDIIHHKFVPEKQTTNGKFYKEMIKRLFAGIHCIRPEFQAA
jgi:hypothetical protein